MQLVDQKIVIDQFHGLASMISWLKSYLSYRENLLFLHLRPPQFLSLQGSGLGTLMFVLYVTPLSCQWIEPISQQHRYADDNRPSISFLPNQFLQKIAIGPNVKLPFDLISSWMSAKLFTLNPAKTEFMVVENQQQLSKLRQTVLTVPEVQLSIPRKLPIKSNSSSMTTLVSTCMQITPTRCTLTFRIRK